MVNSETFDLTVNTFAYLVTKLRTMLNQFTKISRKRKPDSQINSVQTKKRRVSDVENILPPELLEKILKLLNFLDICKAQFICKRWKDIIIKGNLLKKASGKITDLLD